jgi:MGT family glycosyltransferase
MTNVLIGTMPVTGHVRPLLPIARQLVESGHRVLWYTGAKFRPHVEAVGARYAPIVKGLDYDDADLDATFAEQGRPAPGVDRLIWDVQHAFVAPIRNWATDIQFHAEAFQPDVLLSDQGFTANVLVAQLCGLPSVVVSVSPYMATSIDTAPGGLGLPPRSGPIGRVRNRMLNAIVSRKFSAVQREADAVLADLGLPPRTDFLMDWTVRLADRFLMLTVPGFEYPRSDLPSTVEFIGAVRPQGVDHWAPPPWWNEVLDARAAGRPVVVLTQGTIATDPANLLLPGVRALAGADALVVATTGGPDPELVLPVGSRPPNLRLEQFVPFTELLPLADLMITNGGYGGTQLALADGVPLVVAGRTEDKMEVSARVGWSGAGIALMTDTPTEREIASSVRKVLSDSTYRAAAQRLQQEYAKYDAVRRAVDVVLETVLARSGMAR